MSQKKKPVKGENLSDAIRSLQSLLDDVSTDRRTLLETTVSSAESPIENKFEETLEFDSESTGAAILVSSDEASAVDIDSHF